MNQNIPRVSVGMPVYNGERFIAQAIESILSQTFRDLELIISDNASTDATEQSAESMPRGTCGFATIEVTESWCRMEPQSCGGTSER